MRNLEIFALMRAFNGGNTEPTEPPEQDKAEKVEILSYDEYMALEAHDEKTLYVVQFDGATSGSIFDTATIVSTPERDPTQYHEEFTMPVLTAVTSGIDLLLGEKSTDLYYELETREFAHFSDDWSLTTEEQWEAIQADENARERWPWASIEEEAEARSKVRLEGLGQGFHGTYADGTAVMTITNSTSSRFAVTFDPKEKKYSENARTAQITLPRALTLTDTLTIDGAKRKAYITDENGKMKDVPGVNWDNWQMFLNDTYIYLDEGSGSVSVTVRKCELRNNYGPFDDIGAFFTVYLE